MKNLANNYFLNNLHGLKTRGVKNKARAKWTDGTQAYKTSIYQVFEKYPKGVLPIHGYRETAIKSAIQEMLWIYKDQTSCLTKAHDRGIYWWDEFDVGDGTIGQAYGDTVYKHRLLDQLLYDMVNTPQSNRLGINLDQEKDKIYQKAVGGLIPCAYETRYTIIEIPEEGIKQVNMHLNIRSSDYITAGAINRIQYYCLGLQICGHLTKETEIVHELGDFSVFTNDLHVYNRHEFALDELMSVKPLEEAYEIRLKGVKNFYEYDIEDFEIVRKEGIYKLSKKLELAV